MKTWTYNQELNMAVDNNGKVLHTKSDVKQVVDLLNVNRGRNPSRLAWLLEQVDSLLCDPTSGVKLDRLTVAYESYIGGEAGLATNTPAVPDHSGDVTDMVQGECTDCDGEGEHYTPNGMTTTTPCERCGGDGSVPAVPVAEPVKWALWGKNVARTRHLDMTPSPVAGAAVGSKGVVEEILIAAQEWADCSFQRGKYGEVGDSTINAANDFCAALNRIIELPEPDENLEVDSDGDVGLSHGSHLCYIGTRRDALQIAANCVRAAALLSKEGK